MVSVLNEGHTQDVALTHLMRCLAFLAAFHGFHFSSVHVPGRLNKAADALSDNNLTLFHSLLSQALQESIIPLSVVQRLVSEVPDWGSPTWTKLFNSCLGRGRLFNTILLHHRLEMLLQLLQAVPTPALLLMETTLCGFVAFLANRSLSPQTVSSACRFFHIASGLSDLCPS